MVVQLRTKRPDATVKQIAETLETYHEENPRAEIEVYRQNSVSVRIRVINPDFSGQSRSQREDRLWTYLDQLSDDVAAEISLLLLLTPGEAKKSFANQEFDNPIPSRL